MAEAEDIEDWALTDASPDTHIYGMFAVVLHGAWVGSFFHGLPAFDLEAFCSKASELKANAMHIVPPVALALAASPIAQKYDMSEVRRIIVAAAPLKVWGVHPGNPPRALLTFVETTSEETQGALPPRCCLAG